MHYLKQSTAVTLKIGPFLDDTDGKTAETGLTITQAEVRLSKNGGDIAQKTEATSCTHDELGIYGCPIDATDTGTLGRLQLWVHESGALPVFIDYMVVTANFYDSLFSTDKLQVDVTQIAGSAQAASNLEDFALSGYDPSANLVFANVIEIIGNSQSAIDLKDFADAGYDPSTNKIEGVKLADTTTTNTDMRGTDGANTTVPDAAGVAPTAAEIKTEVAAALADIKLDHLLNIAVDTNWATTVHLDSVIGHLADVGTAATFSRTTDALEAIRNQGDSAWLTAAGFSTHSAADVKTAIEQAGSSIATILADTNELQTDWVNGGRLDLLIDALALEATVNSLNNISAADVNTQVVDVLKTDTIAEMAQGAPPASPTFEQAINYLYRKLRNKTETTATEDALYDDAGTTKLIKSVLSDNGTTFTKAEYISGV